MAVTNYYSVGGEIIGEKTAGSSRVDYLTDALGSVTATLNQSAQVVNTYRYKPYGTQLAKTGTGTDPAFTWVGSQGYRQTARKYSDVYVRARHYSSSTGRWTTVDPFPILPLHGTFYYANSSPTLLWDFYGLYRNCSTDSCLNHLDDLCGYFAQNGGWGRLKQKHPGAVGTVVCCKDKKVACTSPDLNDPGLLPGIRNCVLQHERKHTTQDCQCSYPEAGGGPDPDLGICASPDNRLKQDECSAYKAQILCLFLSYVFNPSLQYKGAIEEACDYKDCNCGPNSDPFIDRLCQSARKNRLLPPINC